MAFRVPECAPAGKRPLTNFIRGYFFIYLFLMGRLRIGVIERIIVRQRPCTFISHV